MKRTTYETLRQGILNSIAADLFGWLRPEKSGDRSMQAVLCQRRPSRELEVLRLDSAAILGQVDSSWELTGILAEPDNLRQRRDGRIITLGSRVGSVRDFIGSAAKSCLADLTPNSSGLTQATAMACLLTDQLVREIEVGDLCADWRDAGSPATRRNSMRQVRDWRGTWTRLQAGADAVAAQIAADFDERLRQHMVATYVNSDMQFIAIERASLAEGISLRRLARRWQHGSSQLGSVPILGSLREAVDSAEKELRELADLSDRVHADARSYLRERVPWVLSPLDLALTGAARHGVRLKVAAGHAKEERRRRPLEIWLTLNASRPSAVIEVHVPHKEFILENQEGELFFVPATALVAQLGVYPDKVVPLRGLIHLPEGQSRWRYAHPYVGDCLAEQQELVIGKETLDVASSLFSQLVFRQFPAVPRPQGARRRDMCLSEQDVVLAGLARRVEGHWKARFGRTGRLADYFLGANDLVRVGLTNGHQRNQDTPRIKLTAERMPYPVPEGMSIPEEWRPRIYTYDQRRWTPDSRPETDEEAKQ